jgi:hypothetical protein
VAITEKTRQADEKLREQLRHVDPAKLKKVIKVLAGAQPEPREVTTPRKK